MFITLAFSMDAFFQSHYEYNLLPWRQQKYQQKILRIVIVCISIILFMVLLGWGVHQRFGKHMVVNQHKQEIYQKKIHDLQPHLQVMKQWQADLARIQEKKCWILKLQTGQQKIPQLLQQIAVLTPKEISVTSMMRRDKRIFFSGVSEDTQSLFVMVKQLEKLNGLHQVHFNQVNVKPQQHRHWLSNFTIECTLDDEDRGTLCA